MIRPDQADIFHKEIVKLQAESMVMQIMLTGLMMELKQIEGGDGMIKRMFDYTAEVTAMYATQKDQATTVFTQAVGMTDHWRKMLKV